jgi:hypothetical protein
MPADYENPGTARRSEQVGRVEYWNDPAAPKPNSLVPACGLLAVDDHSGRYAALPCARRAPPPGAARSASRSTPGLRCRPRRRRFRRRPAGRARRERPGSRSSSPGTREGRPCDRRPRAVPGRGRTPRGEPPGGELPVDDQAQHMAIEAAPVRIAGAQKDPAAQNVHPAIPASRRVARKVIENARGNQDNPVILTISPGWLEVMVVLSP